MNALANVVPSFTAQAFGGDMANQTLQAKLRGLSPNHTLVLVNGKRRHTTGSLAILGGPYQGGAGVGPQLHSGRFHRSHRSAHRRRGRAIRHGRHRRRHQHHPEERRRRRRRQLHQGGHYAGDGETDAVLRQHRLRRRRAARTSTSPAEYREHEHTNRGDIDPRVVDPDVDPMRRHVPQHEHAVRAGLSVSEPDLWRRRLRDQTGLDQRRHSDRRQHRDLRHGHRRRQTRGVVRELSACRAACRTRIRTPARSPTSGRSASVRARKPRRPISRSAPASRATSAPGTGTVHDLRQGRDRHVHARFGQRLAVRGHRPDAGGFLRRHVHADAMDDEPRCHQGDRHRAGQAR